MRVNESGLKFRSMEDIVIDWNTNISNKVISKTDLIEFSKRNCVPDNIYWAYISESSLDDIYRNLEGYIYFYKGVLRDAEGIEV